MYFSLAWLGIALGAPADLPALFRADLAQPKCRVHFARTTTVPLLLAEPSVRDLLAGLPAAEKKTTSAPALEKWSSDLLLQTYFDLERELRPVCESDALAALSSLVRAAYLGKLGLRRSDESLADRDFLFRGLIAQKEDLERLKVKLAKTAGATRRSAPELLTALYGAAENVDGVAVLGRPLLPRRALEELLAIFCGTDRPCPFWDRRFLAKVLIVTEPGLAAYIPETGGLVISDSLFDGTVLSKLVLAHELTHGAQHRAQVLDGRDWRAEFAPLSGWRRDGKWTGPEPRPRGERRDALTRDSWGSAFSLLPDPVYGPDPKSDRDGFVFAKSYRQTLALGDVSEDLADHVAAWKLAPDRFCFEGKPVAPKKYRWIGENVFKRKSKLTCSPAPTRGSEGQ